VSTVVLGAGVIGVATAWYLAEGGHRVTVLDRQPGAGLETSYANGGLVTPSMSDPWAAPGVPTLILKYWGREDAPFLLRARALPGMAGWGLRFLRNCTPARWRENTETVLRLGLYSRDALDALTAATGIKYDRSERGNLRVYQDGAVLEEAAASAAMYQRLGLPVDVLDGPACVALEPALRPVAGALAGGVHYKGDRSGDAHAFTQALAARAAERGVTFQFGTTILGLETAGDRVSAIRTDKGRVAGERFVLALASYGAPLARSIGLSLPIQPVKGYSVTLPLGGWNSPPTMPVVDYDRKIAVAPLGQRIRIAGTAEFAGYDTSANPRRGAAVLKAFTALFPECPSTGQAQHWHGLRPMTPDGRPIIGPTRFTNLFVNSGHGPLGWTLACGSGKALADLIGGRRPEIDLAGFSLGRF
jgi:D-amino-acid dehydrogenase